MHLGIDISKDNLDCHKLNANISEAKQFKNTSKGIQALINWIDDGSHVVMEATGVYWENCAIALHEATIAMSVINPAQIKRFGQSKLIRGKTDKMDAKLIAEYAQYMHPRLWTPPAKCYQDLKILVRERESIVAQLSQMKNQHHAHQHRATLPDDLLELSQNRIELFQLQIKTLDKQISELCKEDLGDTYAVLQTIPGIGPVTASVLLAETQGLEQFHDAKQLTAFAGIAPAPNQSGNSKRRSPISKIGNKRIRKVFYLAALQASRHSIFKDLYLRICKRSNSKKLALIAVARKLLVIAFTLAKSKQAFNPNHLISTT